MALMDEKEEATSRKFSLAKGTILIDDLNRWWNLKRSPETSQQNLIIGLLIVLSTTKSPKLILEQEIS